MLTQPIRSSELRVKALPAFNDNYLWVIDNGKEAIAIDPGDATPVLQWLEQENLHLQAILLTHHHADHIGGVETLLHRNPKLTVYGSILEQISTVNFPLQGGELISPFGVTHNVSSILTVMATPGHTRGHLSYFMPQQGTQPAHLFCGDTLFSAGCGRLFEGTAEQMFSSLEKIAALPEDTLVCCAHEYTLSNLRFAETVDPKNAALQAWQIAAKQRRSQELPTVPTTIALEKACNPFLRCTEASVQQGVWLYLQDQNKFSETLIPATFDALTTFTALREWKNHF